jgi:hypothetical protein
MRIGTIAALAAFAALALAGGALATPRLWVVNPSNHVGGLAPTSILIRQDAGTARATVFVPAGYRLPVRLNQRIGRAFGTADVIVAQADGSKLTLSGSVRGAVPQSYANSTCAADKAQHDAVWLIDAKQVRGTASATIPVFVDHVVGGDEAQFGSYKLQVCAASAANMSVTGVNLRLRSTFLNPLTRGYYVWRAVFDPTAPDGKTIASADSVSARALVPLNVQLSVTPKRVAGKRWVTFTGSLLGAQEPLGNVRVRFYAQHSARINLARRPAATVRTKADGTYRVTLRLGRGPWFVRAQAAAPTRDATATGCSLAGEPTAGAKGCVSATMTPFTVRTRVVRVRL